MTHTKDVILEELGKVVPEFADDDHSFVVLMDEDAEDSEKIGRAFTLMMRKMVENVGKGRIIAGALVFKKMENGDFGVGYATK